MAKNLLIVESPAKAKTIEKYLGKDYKVASSYGHVRDLPKTGMSIDLENDFEPTYVISKEKFATVSALKKLQKSSETVWLATDGDREGEAIAWHLAHSLKLDPKTTKRIVFHEITKPAIENAIKNYKSIDQNLVDAQQARRVLDRLVGYELSPILWKKIRAGLSAGRVQSVAVRLVVEKEKEILAFETKSAFKVSADLLSDNENTFSAELSTSFKSEEDATNFLELIKNSKYSVGSIERKAGYKSPSPPFTTSTLQQTAARSLGFSLRQTMRLAQNLYEGGHITYMRTDSVNLSDIAVKQANKYILEKFGETYLKNRSFANKSALAQEAHEAIRPTEMKEKKVSDDNAEQRLYELIWQRTLATQMADAKTDRTRITVDITNTNHKLLSQGEVIVFKGFLELYTPRNSDENILPPLNNGQSLELSEMKATQTFIKPKSRYTEGTLVKKLESLGIGRPSTYAPTISTIQSRGYVLKTTQEGKSRNIKVISLKNSEIKIKEDTDTYDAIRNKLVPTDIGKLVNDFLVKHFPKVVDYAFTADVESEFDRIASGKKLWNAMIKDFYKTFHQTVKDAELVSREEATNTNKLGIDPISKKPVYARMGRYGPMIQIGDKDDDEKPRFAPLPQGKNLDDIKLEDALIMFELPRSLGKTKDGEEIISNIGRFGPYVKVANLFVSIKPLDPFTINLEEARKLIEEKQKANREKIIQDFSEAKIQVLNGRYGPYVTNGKKNAKIPKSFDPSKVTVEDAKRILDTTPSKKKRFNRKK